MLLGSDNPQASIIEKIHMPRCQSAGWEFSFPCWFLPSRQCVRLLESFLGLNVDGVGGLTKQLDRALDKCICVLWSLPSDPVTPQCQVIIQIQGSSEPFQSGTSGQSIVPHQPPPPHLSGSEDSVQEQVSDSDLEELIGVGSCHACAACHSCARELSDSSSDLH